MKWFGESWGAPACDPEEHTETPVGEDCFHCDEEIVEGDSGIQYVSGQYCHTNCFLRQVLGGVDHQLGSCSCHGGPGTDHSHLTKRQEADLAVRLFYERNG